MNLEDFRNYCLAKKGVSEHLPFDHKTLVFKVMNKMFALSDLEAFEYINLKNLPEKNLELRERYLSVQPGYHMSKVHWNSVYVNQDLDDLSVFKLIDESYTLIVNSLPKKVRHELALG